MKTVSATEAKNRLGALLSELANGTDAIVIEHHGRPRAVIVSADEWTVLIDERDRLRRLEAAAARMAGGRTLGGRDGRGKDEKQRESVS